jgi:RhtX/FptX family siderophore transporter
MSALGPASGHASLGKLGLLGTLYFSQGVPFGFFTQALPVLMRKHGYSLREIGLASLLAMPWALKFLWAPLVDRFGFRGVGRRRSWIIPMQILTALDLVALGACSPEGRFAAVLLGVFLVNVFTATQDIAADALAIDILSLPERGVGNGVRVGGYRVGMIVGGGAILILMEKVGWSAAFLGMALLTGLASIPILLTDEAPPRLEESSVHASRHFLRRPGALRILALILTYKAGDAFAIGMLRPFLTDKGLTLADVGELIGTVGFVAGLLGAFVGGALVNRLGRKRSLLTFGVLQALTVAGYAGVARVEPTWSMLYAVCAAEHFAGGMATAALFTCMMDWSRPETSATDYTVQASAVVLATATASTLSGFSAQALGYFDHFVLATILAAATLLVVSRLFPGESLGSVEPPSASRRRPQEAYHVGV